MVVWSCANETAVGLEPGRPQQNKTKMRTESTIRYFMTRLRPLVSPLILPSGYYQPHSLPRHSPSLLLKRCLLPGDYIFQEIPCKARALLKRLFKPGVSAIVRVIHNLSLGGAAVLAKQHDARLGVRVAALQADEVGQVGAVHGEDVVKLVKVGGGKLQNMCNKVSSRRGVKIARAWGAVVPWGPEKNRIFQALGGKEGDMCTYPSRRVVVICDAILFQRRHGAVVGRVACVICRYGGVNQKPVSKKGPPASTGSLRRYNAQNR